ncbi:hypothetical protein GE09DRAFT_1086211 [Coniochaeta sp. 2T2.1]|nr:hypothetical protein GE09DRAFT_1086211 [Coniochaeta sp. 2T2.1]
MESRRPKQRLFSTRRRHTSSAPHGMSITVIADLPLRLVPLKLVWFWCCVICPARDSRIANTIMECPGSAWRNERIDEQSESRKDGGRRTALGHSRRVESRLNRADLCFIARDEQDPCHGPRSVCRTLTARPAPRFPSAGSFHLRGNEEHLRTARNQHQVRWS